MVFIGELNIDFHLYGCTSLKEKRRRLSGLKDRFGTTTNIATCEHSQHDLHDSAVWTFVAISTDKSIIESLLNKVTDHCRQNVDATIIDHKLQWL
ncbi:MAG: hypothetical protein COA42_22485 [Alteromonadaceae bacterium]|nr:MAG: hypothetical protein COA42_22485 [Alteromonadaceae bacterium]